LSETPENPEKRRGPRLDWAKVLPEAREAMVHLESVSHTADLPRPLIELVKIRASHINGCAYCLDMHTKDARAMGEREQRLYALPVWRETPFFSPPERAALAWAEALTKPWKGVGDDVYQTLQQYLAPSKLSASRPR
jgi:AhpD family alkylhydroperoxidase